jgi:hypothetical protein
MSATLIGQEATRALVLTKDSLLCHSPKDISATRGEKRIFSTRSLSHRYQSRKPFNAISPRREDRMWDGHYRFERLSHHNAASLLR